MSKRKSISSIQEGIRHELMFASHASLVNLMLSIVYPRSISLFCQLGCTVTSPLEVRCIEHTAMAEHNPKKIIKVIDATDNEPKKLDFTNYFHGIWILDSSTTTSFLVKTLEGIRTMTILQELGK